MWVGLSHLDTPLGTSFGASDVSVLPQPRLIPVAVLALGKAPSVPWCVQPQWVESRCSGVAVPPSSQGWWHRQQGQPHYTARWHERHRSVLAANYQDISAAENSARQVAKICTYLLPFCLCVDWGRGSILVGKPTYCSVFYTSFCSRVVFQTNLF